MALLHAGKTSHSSQWFPTIRLHFSAALPTVNRCPYEKVPIGLPGPMGTFPLNGDRCSIGLWCAKRSLAWRPGKGLPRAWLALADREAQALAIACDDGSGRDRSIIAAAHAEHRHAVARFQVRHGTDLQAGFAAPQHESAGIGRDGQRLAERLIERDGAAIDVFDLAGGERPGFLARSVESHVRSRQRITLQLAQGDDDIAHFDIGQRRIGAAPGVKLSAGGGHHLQCAAVGLRERQRAARDRFDFAQRPIAQFIRDDGYDIRLQLAILPAALHCHAIAYLQIGQADVRVTFGAKPRAIAGQHLHLAALLSGQREGRAADRLDVAADTVSAQGFSGRGGGGAGGSQ
jgi:hypothetical protein